jgi:hypothetical protein
MVDRAARADDEHECERGFHGAPPIISVTPPPCGNTVGTMRACLGLLAARLSRQ